MKKKECPSCAMEIDEKSSECPVCGFEFPVASKSYKWLAILLLLAFLLTIIGAFIRMV